MKRGTTPHTAETCAFKLARAAVPTTRIARGGLCLRRAPDSNRIRVVRPDTTGLDCVKTPASFTLRRPILGTEIATSRAVSEIFRKFLTPV